MAVRGPVPASYWQPEEGGPEQDDDVRQAEIDRRLDESLAVIEAVMERGGTQEEAVAAHRAHVLARRGS
jgi:hypothetical protein